MRLKTIVRLGTLASVILFALAIGYYAFMHLGMVGNDREISLFSLVPANSIGVLESDNINAFYTEYPQLNYHRELDEFRFPCLFDFLISELNDYTRENAHGLSDQMSRLLVSFHSPGTFRDQVVYFHLGMADEHVLSDMLQEYLPGNFLPKEEEYRGKTMLIYPLSSDEFLATYTEKDFAVLSYQKRLVEEVIDAQLDETALADDRMFSSILEKKKSQHVLTLYGRSASMPFLEIGEDCWSKYDFYMNSDVVYLMGNTYVSEGSAGPDEWTKRLEAIPVVDEEGLMVSAIRDSTAFYMDRAFGANDTGNRTLFNECVANLSNEAAFSLVADMEKVKETPERFQPYLPSFIWGNASLFHSFILSAQLSLRGDSPSHIWVFTYKY